MPPTEATWPNGKAWHTSSGNQFAGQSAAGFQQDGYMRALNACLTARGYTVR